MTVQFKSFLVLTQFSLLKLCINIWFEHSKKSMSDFKYLSDQAGTWHAAQAPHHPNDLSMSSSSSLLTTASSGVSQLFRQQSFWRENSVSADPHSLVGSMSGGRGMFGEKPNITVNPGEDEMNWGRKALHLHQESIL